jgi:hypothetical protein
MYPMKAPGPDGFPAHFFQKHWDLCGAEVTNAVLRILRGEDTPDGINKTFVVLIPKVACPAELGQFRPISLCNVIYKIASKVLANRLKVILPEIISEEQSAFVPGRQITDNIITAYECLHFMKRNGAKRNQHCALKLDMRKAYDRVEWSYLRAIMLRMGFHIRWVDLIMKLVSSVSFSVLFNGTPLDEFHPTRGLRQGDPISPYLFLLAAEGLSGLLKKSRQSASLQGIKVATTAPAVNHLLFADDSLLFVKACEEGAREVSDLLEKYCNASGQRVNLDKSSVFFSKGCPENLRQIIKVTLQVPNETLNEKYLGMPSDIGKSKNGAFKHIKDRVWKHVQGWLEKLLASGGKDVLIKSVAQAIPTFSMSCFRLPRGLCQSINAMLRGFWWGSKDGKRKTAWVSWETMCTPKFAGGLGFRDIELFNLAMLAKQAWMILMNPDTLSSRVLKAVYFPGTNFLEATLGSSPSQIWRAIVEGRDVMAQGLIRRIGTGETTNAWNNNWLPRDFMLRPLACLKGDPPMLVSSFIDASSATWRRGLLEEYFLPMDCDIIRAIPLSTRKMSDCWSWHYEKTGVLSVRSVYRMLVQTKKRREDWLDNRPAGSNSAKEGKLWQQLWKVQVPSKLRIFLWRLAHQSLPTGDVRHHRHMADSSACSICGEADSWRHSLLSCSMARCVWALMDESVTEHMCRSEEPSAKQWLFLMMESLSKEDFARISVTLWAIWHARRKVIFDDEF